MKRGMGPLKVGVLCEFFITWGGGVDFIRLILNGLKTINRDFRTLTIIIFIPKETFQAKCIREAKNKIKAILNASFNKNYALELPINYEHIISVFKSLVEEAEIVFYNKNDLEKKVVEKKVDVALPSFTPQKGGFPIPWIGYLYDFQHRYLGEFFTPEEFKMRETAFMEMMQSAKTIIVNARQVKEDSQKFYPHTITDKVHALPFCPVINSNFFLLENNSNKYNLAEKYFLISNQFWKHKDHPTAFKALRLFVDKTKLTDMSIVCTGQTIDHRFPEYFEELNKTIASLKLEKNIRILGFISKADQLQILKNAVAVIQPTMFEGGPGGGAVYESVAYGIRSIVSDIAVNLEINDPTVYFFKAGSPEDLRDKMIKVYFEPYTAPKKEALLNANEKRLNEFSNILLKIIERSISTFKSEFQSPK
jgi:glycosyltransferase involved in cell wall biosynthesis